jgi:hypothetical protein
LRRLRSGLHAILRVHVAQDGEEYFTLLDQGSAESLLNQQVPDRLFRPRCVRSRRCRRGERPENMGDRLDIRAAISPTRNLDKARERDLRPLSASEPKRVNAK